MAIVQIAIFKSFPHWLQKFFASALLLGVLVNFTLSGVILVFTAAGFLAGISNLAGSVLFGIYLGMYKRTRKIRMLRLDWLPIYCTWNFWFFGKRHWMFRFPCMKKPKMYIPEENPDPKPSWLW
jgi:hypothetical protein